MADLNGYLDRVCDEGVAGWSLAPRVRVSINRGPPMTLVCGDLRPDVQAAGLSADGRVGFHADLPVASGDIVRVTTEAGGSLRHSPWLYLAPDRQGWLPASLAFDHPEYAAIADLNQALKARRFRPLFGQLGQVSAVLLDFSDSSPRVACLGVSRREANILIPFYRELLAPSGIAVPALLGGWPQRFSRQPRQQALIFDYAPGLSLDSVGEGWERWLPSVRAELVRLRRAGERQRPSGRGRPAVLRRLLRGAFAQAMVGRNVGGERAFLFWLLGTLLRLPRVLSHGDLHRQNVVVDERTGTLALIDWDRWGYLPAGFDMALLMRGLSAESAESWAGDDPVQRLGVLGFTYLFQRLDRPGFVVSAEAERLRQRCKALSDARLGS